MVVRMVVRVDKKGSCFLFLDVLYSFYEEVEYLEKIEGWGYN